ncbi:FAD-dependent oxidoreductase [Chelatococcus asaccharovorans]|uniref:FAD dependent oxidoreductase n=1 Tax=Chelatococcus asaccharovorans TaxID=28210 RepID=A0A2V3UC90_9HYPH|nr:FAD-dependent oxidoreductase [Chelatococcus asaccharovorans]MBS7703242.1 FAD-dependent oxidoreductase [Chelatococcus asaccharovorans]PXW61572.1 FAD dependent oxidoreductase [Chelatococcus asaccharovorans]
MGSMTEDGGRLFFRSESFAVKRGERRRGSDRIVQEPAQTVPVHTACDVLVVGGGPAGTAAAVAAARLGADVVLLERYNHLGGLSTGGLVIWIDRMSDWSGRHVIRGFAEELLSRLTPDKIAGPPKADWGSGDPAKVAYWSLRSAAYNNTVTHSPTLDPEWLKAESLAMALEAGVHLIFHAWGASPIVEDGQVAGCIFESKEGRRAVLAKVTIDATGDGDLYARAGAGFVSDVDVRDIHGCMNTAWLFGGVDMDAFLKFRAETPSQFSDFMARGRERLGSFERPVVSWRQDIAVFMGPRLAGYSALKVEDLSEVEIRSRKLMLAHFDFYREHAPGFGDAFIMLSAPQIGVRHGRRLDAAGRLTREMWDGRVAADEIGVSPSLAPKFANISVPYGAIVPRDVGGLLAPGRHLACDATSHSFMREIPQCWLTGHAAGVAAALAADRGCAVADVPIGELRMKLSAQGAYLNPLNAMAID